MAARSGWDTIFAEPIRWSRNKTVKECWNHIGFAIVAALYTMVFLWYTQGHRYLYNYQYGPFVLSEQEILDTRPKNLWKQYIQVHHGTALDLNITEVTCFTSKCKPMVLQFKKRAAHNRNISQLVVKRPYTQNHYRYSVRQPINFSVMSVTKLMVIIRAISMEKMVIPGMEKSELVSIITTTYDSNPKKFNHATESHVLVGFLTDFSALDVYKNLTYMDLILDTSDPYIAVIPTARMCVLFGVLVLFAMKIVYYTLKMTQTWASTSRIYTPFASTDFQRQILHQPLRHIVQGQQVNNTDYEYAALMLQEEILSDEVATIVNEEHFRLYVTNTYVIYAKHESIDVISVSTIETIRAWRKSCDVVLSNGERRTLYISSDQASHMRNALRARSLQLDERRTTRQRAEWEVRRRRRQEIINEQLANLADFGGFQIRRRPVTEEAVKEIRESTCELKKDSGEKCTICQDKMKTGEMVTKFSCPGKHPFHEDCLLEWLEHGSSCPLCRHPAGHRSRRENATRALRLVFT